MKTLLIKNWCFNLKEFYFLAGILKLSSLMGLSDPFLGYLTEEIQGSLETARQSLSERGLLSETGDDVEVDPDLRKVLQAVSTSPKVLVAAKDQSSILIHISEDCIVKQETTSDNRISLSTLLDWDEANNHLNEFLSLPESSAAPGSAFTTNASVIEQARELIQNNEQDNPRSSCKQALVEKGISPESAAALTTTLSEKHSTGSLVIFDRNESKLSPQGGFAWLTGDLGTWKVDLPPSEDVDFMKWTPKSSALLNEQIEAFISSEMYRE